MSDLEKFMQSAEQVALEAGILIRDTCGSAKSVESKLSYADLVTETDKNVEKLVFDTLRKLYPDHKFIGEESVAADDYGEVELTDDPTWIVDPVDGTTNFVHGFPYVSVSIGLTIKKEPVLGVVYFPVLDQMFKAIRGKGSYCNTTKLSVKCAPSLRESLVLTELGSDRSPEKKDCVFKNMESIGWRCHGLRSLGSATGNICAVAAGQAQAFYEFGLHCWDICAASVVLTEAGGYVCDTSGNPLDLVARRVIVACDKKIADELSQSIVVQMKLPSD